MYSYNIIIMYAYYCDILILKLYKNIVIKKELNNAVSTAKRFNKIGVIFYVYNIYIYIYIYIYMRVYKIIAIIHK